MPNTLNPPRPSNPAREDHVSTKFVYSFGPWGAEGDASMKNSLGGKGANLAEMCRLKLPVPAGFTISTEFCTVYLQGGKQFPDSLKEEVAKALARTEEAMGKKYGDAENPLLMSCRSGARKSMPGMMETVLNVGLCPATIPGLVKKSGNERFVWDAYRRLIMMYSDVVMEKAEDIEPAEGHGIRHQLEDIMAALEEAEELQVRYRHEGRGPQEALRRLQSQGAQQVLGKPFPDDPQEQLWGAIGAVFKSWQGKRAVSYRRIEGIPEEWGTACNVQSMVFGNMGDDSATGVAFSRNPATGENKFYGEWLVNAQGEDVVAGIRTPSPINEATKNEQNKHLSSLETAMPELYQELYDIRTQARAPLPRHAGHRVHDRVPEALHAPVPQRQADGHGGLEHGHGHAAREADRRGHRRDPRRAGPVGRAAAPDHRSGRREGPPRRSSPGCPPDRAGPAARSSSPRPKRWKRPPAAKR